MSEDNKEQAGECGVYQTRNLNNGKVYIGSSSELRKRRNKHYTQLNRGCHKNQYLQRSWNKHGEENFKFEVIIKCDEERQFDYEGYWLNRKKPYKEENGYNIVEEPIRGPRMEKENNPNWKDVDKLICEYCDKEYRVPLSEVERSRFCTRSCASKHYAENKRVGLICKNCGNTFTVPKFKEDERKFCGKACSNKGQIRNQKGTTNNNSKLSESEVVEIKEKLESTNKLQKEIARQYGVGQSIVSRIKNDEYWDHV